LQKVPGEISSLGAFARPLGDGYFLPYFIEQWYGPILVMGRVLPDKTAPTASAKLLTCSARFFQTRFWDYENNRGSRM